MDKTTTALIATEDNAAAIRALGNKLLAQTEKMTAALDEVKKLSAQIAELQTKLDSRTSNKLITGRATSSMTTFGTIMSDGSVCVLIYTDGTASRTVFFNGTPFATVYSIALVMLPKGTGEVTMAGTTAASLLILGSVTAASKA